MCARAREMNPCSCVRQLESSVGFRPPPLPFKSQFTEILLFSPEPLTAALSSAERQVFLATWKDIPNENEAQFQIKDCHLNSGNAGRPFLLQCLCWMLWQLSAALGFKALTDPTQCAG